MAALGDLCAFLNGGTPSRSVSRFYTGEVPWITGADITAPLVKDARSFITEEAIHASATNLVPAGTVLLVTRTSVGKVAIAGRPLCFSQDITGIKPDKRKLDVGYLVHFLRTQQTHFERVSRGATIKGITRDAVEKLGIPLLPLPEQQRIAAILDAADALRAKRRATIQKLDELTQSIFIDMFGDPATNPKGWQRVPLKGAYWFQEGPGVRRRQFKPSGVKLLNVGNIVADGHLDLGRTTRFISEEEANGKYRHFLVDEGDLVIASSGISFDKDGMLRTRGAFVSGEHLPLCMNTSTIRFKAHHGISDLRFLWVWLAGAEFRRQISKRVTGTAQQNFGPSHLAELSITLPPQGLQQGFAQRLDRVEMQRANQLRWRAGMDRCFASLQRCAFRGEL